MAGDDILTFLQWMKSSGRAERSVIILYGDHGPDMDAILSTDIGRFTHRLTYLAIALNDHFPKEVYDNLKANAERQTTPFDLHATYTLRPG